MTSETMTLGAATPYDRADRRRRIWAIFASSSGNLVEWFDFYAYAFTALYFAPAFFPKGNQTTQLLQTAAVFAIGFLMRPVGGYVFGFVADKYGRKNSMMISVLMMCAGSLAIAVLPTYETIGTAAPVLLLLARMVQGLSVGGEYGTSATYMSEVALPGKRGFYASFQYVTLIGGQLLASLVVLIVQLMLSDAELRAWGWRIPFFIGAIFAVVALFLRTTLTETSSAETRSRKEAGSLREIFKHHTRAFLIVLGLYRRRLADLLHIHHLHAEIFDQHRAYERSNRQCGDDRGTVHLHGHAAAVRCVFRSLRPQDIDAAVRRTGNRFHGAPHVRHRRRQEPLCGVWFDRPGARHRVILHVNQRTGESGNVSARSTRDERRPCLCDRQRDLRRLRRICSAVVQG